MIGVCKGVDEVTRLTTKSNREVSKRTLNLMDMSGKVVTVTLWGEEVSTADVHPYVLPSIIIHEQLLFKYKGDPFYILPGEATETGLIRHCNAKRTAHLVEKVVF